MFEPAGQKLAIADADVDPEVDAEPDEEHRETDRDQVEVPDRRSREAGRPDQTHDQGDERREHHSERTETESQDDRDEYE
ncbi:MAG: hypothetical protein JRJ05_13985 [Deltaproteobacteria bacterium]|nr:hypothetical protein [Deltaproteobacteria bacterium]